MLRKKNVEWQCPVYAGKLSVKKNLQLLSIETDYENPKLKKQKTNGSFLGWCLGIWSINGCSINKCYTSQVHLRCTCYYCSPAYSPHLCLCVSYLQRFDRCTYAIYWFCNYVMFFETAVEASPEYFHFFPTRTGKILASSCICSFCVCDLYSNFHFMHLAYLCTLGRLWD